MPDLRQLRDGHKLNAALGQLQPPASYNIGPVCVPGRGFTTTATDLERSASIVYHQQGYHLYISHQIEALAITDQRHQGF